jgi:hypothetical protein
VCIPSRQGFSIPIGVNLLKHPNTSRPDRDRNEYVMSDKVTVDLTTGVGTISFPRIFPSTKGQNDKGEDSYECQILIPKSDKKTVKALLEGIKTVGEAKWKSNYKKVRHPLRDGDHEAGDVTDDGKTKGEKYPERKGHYFLNARSKKPVGVFDRKLVRIPDDEHDKVYGGCKGKISITLYPYANNGNSGIGASLNGVQKVSDGEPFGGGAPPVESMFDLMEDEGGDGVDFDTWEAEVDGGKKGKKGKKDKAPEPEPEPKKGKKGKSAPEPEPEPEPKKGKKSKKVEPEPEPKKGKKSKK